jgi:hypothetical protein
MGNPQKKAAEALHKKLYALAEHKESKDVNALDRAYNILTILDDKASGLMTVNAFLGAIPAISIDHYKDMLHPSLWSIFALWFSVAILVGLIISALLCFRVVRVKWPFLHLVKAGGGQDFVKEEMAGLVNVIGQRTSTYRWAWRITALCVVGMLLLVLLYIIL